MTDPSGRCLHGRCIPAISLLAVLVIGPAAAAQDFDVACPSDEEVRVVELVNDERSVRGLGALAPDVRLGAAALGHSADMADGCFLSHTGSDGSNPGERVLQAGYGSFAGEVAGAGHPTPEMIVDGWMNSPGHFAIIMAAGSTHIGVGHVRRASCRLQTYGFYASDFWTANLGSDPGPHFDEQDYCEDGVPIPPPGGPCDDGLDNDGDGLIDFVGGDPGCDSASDTSERSDALPCDDGDDNDGDGRIDFDPVTYANPGDATDPPAGTGDAGCWSPHAGPENPACQDGIDNNGDGKIDYDAGLSANGTASPQGPDPACGHAWGFYEKQWILGGFGCGLGFELVLVLPPLIWMRKRRFH